MPVTLPPDPLEKMPATLSPDLLEGSRPADANLENGRVLARGKLSFGRADLPEGQSAVGVSTKARTQALALVTERAPQLTAISRL